MKTIIIASTNEGKIREIKNVIDGGFGFKSYKDFPNWPNVEETGQTFLENSILKAKILAEKYNLPAIADDSGLEVEALGGAPGIKSARYAGDSQDDQKNIAKLLENLKGVSNRSARFVTVAVYFKPDGSYLKTEGEVKGEIVDQPKGNNGFGYDPVFLPEGFDKTMAQLTLDEKNAISHRGKAFRQLKELLISSSVSYFSY
jgi:XTP/dITP diphosphohydrolase